MENSLEGSTNFGFTLLFCFVNDFVGEVFKVSRLLDFGESGASL